MRAVTIFLLFHDGVFRDAFASYSEAMRERHAGNCCEIRRISRMEY